MNNHTKQNEKGDFDPNTTIIGTRGRKVRGELQVGDVVLRRYELLEKLGSGAMGVVFKCQDQVSGVCYVLKMVPPKLARDEDAMENVRANFQLVHNLKHPNIAGADFLDRDEYGAYFLIMEYADGISLSRWIREKWDKGGPEFQEVAAIVEQIAAALDYAHAEKVLHRDVKPANVMVDESGKVKVLDFGLASKERSSMTNLSVNPANSSGTPNYMPPEQFKAQYPRPASDEYALGVMTYEMLSGHLPFESGNFEVLRSAVLNDEPEEIENIPPCAWQAIRRAMSKKSSERFASCAEFAAALTGTLPPAGEAKAEKSVSTFPEPKGGNVSSTAPRFAPGYQEPSLPSSPSRENTEAKRDGGKGKMIALILVLAAIAVGVFAVISNSNSSSSYSSRTEDSSRNYSINTDSTVSHGSNQRESSNHGSSMFTGTVTLPENVKLELVKLKAGSFTMGSPEGELGRGTGEDQQRVTLTKDYWLGMYEVTQAQWEAVMGSNPSYFKGTNRPVEQVSWNDAKNFCEKLNNLYTGKLPQGYRFDLPTETQWEYGCRAETATALNNGKNLTSAEGNCPNLDEVGWYDKNCDSGGHKPVGQKKPNAWGLYDMHRNVWEWCRDWYGSYNGDVTDSVGPASGSDRIYRGGSWYSSAWRCRSAYRSDDSPDYCDDNLGFRLALIPIQ